MKLVVIRHGPAGDPDAWEAKGRDDRLRPLTPEGKKVVRRVAAGLATLVRRIDILATSPLVRAVQTAEIIAEAYGCQMVTLDALEPGRDPDKTVQWLGDQRPDQTLALAGHEPHLSTLVSYLLAGKRASFIALHKAGACLLEMSSVKPGGGTLEWLMGPGELGRLGE